MQQSTIYCIEQPNYKDTLVKITNLTKTDQDRVISVRGNVKTLERINSKRSDGKDRICAILEQSDGGTIEIVFFPNTSSKATLKVQERMAVLGAKFNLYYGTKQAIVNEYTVILT